MRLFRLFILSLMLLPALTAGADAGHLYTSDKLSSGLITCICQDRHGFIWIGTEYGLNKFDGYRYTTYFHSRNDSTSIIDNEIATLFVDRDGRLWVGCSRGLVSYDYRHDNFHRYAFPDRLTPRVSSLTSDARNRLLIGTAGYGLYSLEGKGHINYESAFNKRPGDHFYSRIYLDREGNLWRSDHLTTFTKFTVRNGKPIDLHDYQSTCGQPMRFIEYDSKLLIVCMYGILSYDYQSGSLSKAGVDLSLLDSNVSIEDATLDKTGTLYIATSGSGLMRITPNDHRLTRVENGNGRIDLSTANVVDVMEDKDQNLWIACYNKGLLMLSHQQSPFSTWSLSDQHFVTGGGVSSITAGEGDNTWCTVQNSGVFLLDAGGRVTAHPKSPAGTRLIFHSRTGQYWLTTENVLYRYYPETEQAIPELTLNGRGLNCMTEDNQGRLYISTFSMGLYVYDPATKTGELLSMQQTDHPGGHLCNDWIKGLMFDSHGELWICTTNGISLMQPEGRVFNSRGWDMLLEGKQCYTACETTDGNILFGTESGLYCYNRKANKVAEVPGTEPLHGKMICGIVCDHQGDIWISTTNGIWQYKKESTDNVLVGHIAGNGLNTNEYVLGALIHRNDDRISFGTADGLVTFLPRDVSTLVQPLGKTFLTRFDVNGQSLDPTQDHFELSYADNSFTMEFSLMNFKNAENITFQYRIKGSDTWMQNSEGNNQLTFHQLQPGFYTIEVRASANGIVSKQTTTLYVTIQDPWYKTTWAYLFYCLVIAAFGALTAYSWNRYLAEKRLHLMISDLKQNMKWLRGKFFGSLEEKGEIQRVRVKGNNDALMERIVKCVNENLSNPDFGVESMTKEIGISRAQLHRKMKEMTGLSTSEFVRNLRLEQAARLIREKKINITQVAYSVGFNNQAHFSTVFKKHFGMTPTEYGEKESVEVKVKV
ncbi:MAG: helix-turn-helix domain-containing protein [Prevotella sp.]|nr:helix-turn-helix domain-containing protein [Prevotella sp.]